MRHLFLLLIIKLLELGGSDIDGNQYGILWFKDLGNCRISLKLKWFATVCNEKI